MRFRRVPLILSNLVATDFESTLQQEVFERIAQVTRPGGALTP